MRLNKDYWLLNKPVAHRGLWGDEIIENSITAYRNAVEKGYPIEIDVYVTKDDKLVSFHDKTLKRMTGADGFVYEKTLAELKELRLAGTDEQIPTFDEVLAICENKTPILIEIKDQPNNTVVEKVIERLKSYKGEFALQSFNPLYIKKVKKLAPQFIRGILGTHDTKNKSAFTRLIVKKMLLNFLIKPDFISYSYKGIPKYTKKSKKIPVIAWTVTSAEIEKTVRPYINNIIFEHYIPQ